VTRLALGAVVLTLAAAVALLLAWAQRDRRSALSRWQGRLGAVADDRRGTVEVWLKERLRDAKSVASHPAVQSLAVQRGADPQTAGTVHRLLTEVASTYENEALWVLGVDGAVLAGSAPAVAPDAEERRLAEEAWRKKRALLALRTGPDRNRMVVAQPILDEREQARGLVVSETDPTLFLYPLLRFESSPTDTAESFLVETAAGTTRYLTPLRSGPPPGDGRPPVTGVGLEDVGSGPDYRGRETLAALRAIRGTGLTLVVKMDVNEALEEHRIATRFAAVGLLALVGILGAVSLVLWRAQRAAFEVSLERYRVQLSSLVEHANDAIVFMRPDGRIIQANRVARALYGYGQEELSGMRIQDLRTDGAQQAVDPAASGEGGHPQLFETTHRRRDGRTFPVEVSRVLLDHAGEPVLLEVVRDISERKAAEGLANGERRILEMIASGAPLTLTLDTLVLLIESQAPGMLGSILLIEDGLHVRHGAGPHLPEGYKAAIDGEPIGPRRGSCGTAAYRRQPVVVEDIATDPLWEDYREVALQSGLRACWSRPILGTDGTLYGTFALYYGEPRRPTVEQMALIERATSVAAIAIARRRQEEALRQSEAELRSTFEAAAIGMCLADVKGRLVKSNGALQRFLGWSGAELADMTYHDVTHPEDLDRDQALYQSLLKGDRVSYEIEKRYVRRDGETVWGRLTVSMVSPSGGRPRFAVAMVEDITERRRLEHEIQQVQKMEAVGLLAGGIAHDFNNILGVILGYGQILLRGLERGDGRRARVEGMLAAADRAAALTRQLLAFSRRQSLELKVLDLNGVVEDLARMLRRLLSAAIAFEFAPGSSLGWVRGDRSQVEQILINLAVNARDAMPGGGHLTVHTSNAVLDAAFVKRHPGASPGPHVRLSVRDTGTGMAPEVMERVFEPFFTTKGTNGTGLGLSTVYGIVKQSGGYVAVESELGRGTCVSVYLPRVEDLPAPEPADEDRDASGSETILVVEDEEVLRDLIREQLEAFGYTVLVAADAHAAVEMGSSAGQHIDLLLTDVVMPGLNGREVAQRIQQKRPGLRVLYMSGYAIDVMAEHGVIEPGTVLVSKPFMGSTLAAKVREVLGPWGSGGEAAKRR
jgi:two-component system, cell cycle sensor histidine kinase and response regulator CckA